MRGTAGRIARLVADRAEHVFVTVGGVAELSPEEAEVLRRSIAMLRPHAASGLSHKKLGLDPYGIQSGNQQYPYEEEEHDHQEHHNLEGIPVTI